MVSLPAANRDAECSQPGDIDFDPSRSTRTSRSGTAPTTVSAPSWPGWSCRSDRHTCCDRFPGLRLAAGDAGLEWKEGLLARGPKTLPVAW